MISTLRRIFTQIITHKGLNELQALLITLVSGGEVVTQIKEVLSRVLKGEEDTDQENSLIDKYGKQIIDMNLDEILTESANPFDVITLTRVLVDIEPKIALKKVKFISMILVSIITTLNIAIGTE